MYLAIAFLSGVTIVLSRVINYVLSDKIGIFQGTFFNYVLGLLGSIVLLLLSGESHRLFEINAYQGSWWAYTGGLVGVVVIALSSYLSSKISAFYLTLLLFVGQLFTGMLLDYLVANDFSIIKLLGGILVVIGLIYNLIIDKKTDSTSNVPTIFEETSI